jgi:4'-phosphopantetheinyl transferase EntD
MVSERLSILPGVAVVCRRVMPGDEASLTAAETASLAGSVVAVRRRAGSARIAARELLADFGWPGFDLPRIAGRGPLWPEGVTGSLSHAEHWAAASVASRRAWQSVGIDIEPAEPLDDDVLDLIATPTEARSARADRLAGRLLWCAKEAAYKAMFGLDGVFLEPRDLIVDWQARAASAAYGRSVGLAVFVDARVILALSAA